MSKVKSLAERIFSSWKTTLLGIGILIACFVFVLLEKATLTEISVFLGGGFYLLFSKDSVLEKHGKDTTLIIMLLVFVRCCPIKSTVVERIETVRDTVVFVDSIPFVFYLPGDTVLIKSEPIVIRDTFSRVQFEYIPLTIDPWFASNEYTEAEAGIVENIPYIKLSSTSIVIDTMVYINRISILEKQLKDRSEIKIRGQPFFENCWFWISILLSTIILVIFKLK